MVAPGFLNVERDGVGHVSVEARRLVGVGQAIEAVLLRPEQELAIAYAAAAITSGNGISTRAPKRA